MNAIFDTLSGLVAAAMFGPERSRMVQPLSLAKWRDIYKVSARHGILAVVYDAVVNLPDALKPPRELMLQWAYNVEIIEARYHSQLAGMSRLVQLYGESGIPILLLKGYGISQFYPIPNHRSFGDIDFYLFDKFKEATQIAIEHGAEKLNVVTKHTSFDIFGVHIENHATFLNIERSFTEKVVDRFLVDCITSEIRNGTTRKDSSGVILPSPVFNYIFLLMHSLKHYLTGGIGLRHICDWVLFLRANEAELDYDKVYDIAKTLGIATFADVINEISNRMFRTNLPVLSQIDNQVVIRVMDDIQALGGQRKSPLRYKFEHRHLFRLFLNESLYAMFLRSFKCRVIEFVKYGKVYK